MYVCKSMCALNVLNKNERNFIKTNNETETKIVRKGLFAFPLTVNGGKRLDCEVRVFVSTSNTYISDLFEKNISSTKCYKSTL